VRLAAGPGSSPLPLQGRAYLAGPYLGAPLSLAIITPALAGPFDLGTVLTRVALHVDPASARIHAISDPLPTSLAGIPLDIRSLALDLDRPHFTRNPTSCRARRLTARLTSTLGQSAALANRFQVGACAALGFAPRLRLRLVGSTEPGSNPALIANLDQRPGEAGIAAARLRLPLAAELDNAHLGEVCSRAEFAADRCPPGALIGRVRANTPLLDAPLRGAVYLRTDPARGLPELVAALRGPAATPIEIDLAAKIDTADGALRATFRALPDTPLGSLRLKLFGGRHGLIELGPGLCREPRSALSLRGQNGKARRARPPLRSGCQKKRG
jgi:hypothetical protein